MSDPKPPHALELSTLADLYSPRLVALVKHALTYPESSLEAPWDFPLVKSGGKIVCMFNETEAGLRFTCKLKDSLTVAMDRPDISPASHNLGKYGWISQVTPNGEALEIATMHRWMEESFRLVAKKGLIKEWDAKQ